MNEAFNAFGFTHKSGILMSVSSLPSKYGIGSFGKNAYDFVDFLEKCGQTVWQVLPLNPTSYGDSPYQSPASAAGNPYFVDLDILAEKGLLTEEELKNEEFSSEFVDYGRLFNTRYNVLRRAYSRFDFDGNYRDFCEKNLSWLENYALFMALKVHYNYCSWVDWEPCHKDFIKAKESKSDFAEEMGFWSWIQYEFFEQWQNLHRYANSKGIRIIGDMPIYVAHDSMDVWCAPEQFLLDENYCPNVVAGCPPDDFAPDGQKWGNPIYNWDSMAEDGFSWWILRVGRAFDIYDLLRIDHFRGFAGYFSIPAEDDNARRGEWCKGPSCALFDALKSEYPSGKIIAEDLGFITEDVRELLAHTGFPGMKVLQFAFYSEDSEYLPRCYTTDNCIVYTSTHDSDTAKSWFEELDSDALKLLKKEYRLRGKRSGASALIDMAMSSRANLAVVAMQDYLELTNEEGRMNVPSKPDGNWTWRISSEYNTYTLRKRIKAFAEKHGRLK